MIYYSYIILYCVRRAELARQSHTTTCHVNAGHTLQLGGKQVTEYTIQQCAMPADHLQANDDYIYINIYIYNITNVHLQGIFELAAAASVAIYTSRMHNNKG